MADARAVAEALGRFVEWLVLAGAPNKQAFRVFASSELRNRFDRLELAIAGCGSSLPASARNGLATLRSGMADELKECRLDADASSVSLGVFTVREWQRLAALASLLAREAAEPSKKLPPAPKR